MATIETKLNVNPGDVDLVIELTLSSQGKNLKPDWNEVELALEFPQNDETEIAFGKGEFNHDIQPGCDIQFHAHILQNQNVTPKFRVAYRIINMGVAPTAWVNTDLDVAVYPYTSGTIGNMIKGVARTSGLDVKESTILNVKIFRITGDGYAGDCLVSHIDTHYVAEKIGKTFV